jgi:hypothetical protein
MPVSTVLDTTYDQDVADRVRALIAAFAMTSDCSLVIGAAESTPHFKWGHPDTISLPSTIINSENEHYALYVTLHEIGHQKLTVPQVLPAWFSRDTRMHVLVNALEDLRVDCRCAIEYAGASSWIASCASKVLEQVLDEDQDDEPCPVLQLLFGLITRLWSGVMPQLHVDAQKVMDEIWPAVLRSTTIAPGLGPVDTSAVERRYGLHQVSLHPATADMAPWQKDAAMYQMDWFNYVESNVWPQIRWLIDRHGSDGLERLSRRLRSMDQMVEGGASSAPNRKQTNPTSDEQPYMACIRKHHHRIEELQQILIDRFESNQNQKYLDRQPSGERLNMKQLLRFDSGEKQCYDQLFLRKIPHQSTSVSVYVVIDRSSSMNASNARRRSAAFESSVVIADTCKRLGIPGHVYLFDSELRHYLDTEDTNDETYRSAISGLSTACEGNTNLAGALQSLDAILNQDMNDNILCLILTDEDVPSDQIDLIRRKLNLWKMSGFKTAVFQMLGGTPTNGFIQVGDPANLPALIAGILDKELVG